MRCCVDKARKDKKKWFGELQTNPFTIEVVQVIEIKNKEVKKGIEKLLGS